MAGHGERVRVFRLSKAEAAWDGPEQYRARCGRQDRLGGRNRGTVQQNNATAEDTDNFINFVRSTKGVEVAVLFRQTADRQYKISLRSKGRVDLSGVAQSLGGGGHKNAAGATIDGTLSDVKVKVIGAVTGPLLPSWGTEQAAHGRRS